MGFRSLLATLSIFLFISSCASTGNQYLSSDYSDGIENTTVTILPIQADSFFEAFPNYAFGKLEYNEAQTFNSYLPSFIETNSSTKVLAILDGEQVSAQTFEMKKLSLEGETLEIIGPKEEEVVRANNQDSRFVLILDQYNYQRYSIETGGGNYAGHEMEKESRLKFETKYLIWDNDLGKAAAWGKVNADKKYTGLEGDQIYTDLLNNVIRKIIQRSPFS